MRGSGFVRELEDAEKLAAWGTLLKSYQVILNQRLMGIALRATRACSYRSYQAEIDSLTTRAKASEMHFLVSQLGAIRLRLLVLTWHWLRGVRD